jgi:hypothetical protein
MVLFIDATTFSTAAPLFTFTKTALILSLDWLAKYRARSIVVTQKLLPEPRNPFVCKAKKSPPTTNLEGRAHIHIISEVGFFIQFSANGAIHFKASWLAGDNFGRIQYKIQLADIYPYERNVSAGSILKNS